MSFALSAGVTGLQAHQKMLDVAGNNLANVNTTAFKSSRITFSELLSETIKKASQPTTTVGGTNPQQMGSGVGVAGISPNMAQGNIVNTGNPLDLALEGEGYFVLNDGSQNLYTRAGAFGVDAGSSLIDPTLVDPATGYRVQRVGNVGEADDFQVTGNSNIRVPYGVTLGAKDTESITVQGNLSANAVFATPQTQKMTANLKYTTGTGTTAVAINLIDELDQFSGGSGTGGSLGAGESGTISYSGYKPDGTDLDSDTAVPTVALTQSVTPTTTLDDILTKLNGSGGTTETSEVQTLTPDAAPTSGTFTLTVNGETIATPLAFGATAAQIKTALETLSTVGTDEIAVSGTLATAVAFTFDDTAGDVGMIGFDFSGLDAPTTQAGSAIVQTTKGVAIAGILGGEATATLVNGKIVLTDADDGYSQTDLTLSYAAAGSETHSLEEPAYFEMTTVGGEEVKNVSITVYDSLGGKHVLSGAFVRVERTGTLNTWDMVLTSVTGDINAITMDNRRIKDITFDATDGSYKDLAGSDASEFVVTFAHDPTNPQTIEIAMGTVGKFDGLTQLAGNSTAVAREQDGYESGTLATVSVDNEGIVIGSFSNGIKKELATIQITLFKNPAALENIGGGYFTASANSGTAVETQAMSAGAGTVHGGALEKSNSDVATEFVNMIKAQNGFQANARTIRVANDILRELTNLIR